MPANDEHIFKNVYFIENTEHLMPCSAACTAVAGPWGHTATGGMTCCLSYIFKRLFASSLSAKPAGDALGLLCFQGVRPGKQNMEAGFYRIIRVYA